MICLSTMFESIRIGLVEQSRGKSGIYPTSSKSHYDYLERSAKKKKERVVVGIKELIQANQGWYCITVGIANSNVTTRFIFSRSPKSSR